MGQKELEQLYLKLMRRLIESRIESLDKQIDVLSLQVEPLYLAKREHILISKLLQQIVEEVNSHYGKAVGEICLVLLKDLEIALLEHVVEALLLKSQRFFLSVISRQCRQSALNSELVLERNT